MSQKISLKQAERKVFTFAVNDGLLDIIIGSFVMQFAIAPILSDSLGDFWSSAVFIPFWLLVFTGVLLVRKYVVTPRIGFVKFGQYRKRILKKLIFIMLAVNLIAFLAGIFFMFKFKTTSGFIHMFFVGFIILFISSIAAYFLNAKRFFLYGLLFLLSLVTGELLFFYFKISHHGFPVTFGITSGIIITTGLVLFLRLIRTYPLPSKEPIPEEYTG